MEKGLSVYMHFNIRLNFAALWLLENVLTFLSPFFAFISEIISTADVSVEHYTAYLIQNMRICVAKKKSVCVWTRVMTIVAIQYLELCMEEAIQEYFSNYIEKLGWQLSYDLYVQYTSAFPRSVLSLNVNIFLVRDLSRSGLSQG